MSKPHGLITAFCVLLLVSETWACPTDEAGPRSVTDESAGARSIPCGNCGTIGTPLFTRLLQTQFDTMGIECFGVAKNETTDTYIMFDHREASSGSGEAFSRFRSGNGLNWEDVGLANGLSSLSTTTTPLSSRCLLPRRGVTNMC